MVSKDDLTWMIPAGYSPLPTRKEYSKISTNKLLNEIQTEILQIKQRLMEINKRLNEVGNE